MPEGLIVQPSYRVRHGRAVIQLFGRLQDGRAFLVEDDRFRPYFFVAREDAGHLADADGVEIEATELRAMGGGPVVRVVANLPGEVPRLRETLEHRGAAALEADIRFPYRFLIDHGIRAALAIVGSGEESGGLLRFHNPEISPARCRPALRTLSIDLETSPDASTIFAAALIGGDTDEVHLVSESPVDGAVCHPDERTLLAAVAGRIRALDPDVITGWNVVDFDLRTWDARARALGEPADLGRIPGGILFQQDPGFTRQSRATVPGRMILDGIPLVRDAVRLEDYRLETVGRQLLGRGKLIDQKVEDKAAEITRLYREEPAALVAYNREDARLVLDILEQEGLLELALERSLLSGMQLDRVGASIASFDLLYLPELRRRGRVAPSVDRERKSAAVKGGALLDPQPGIFQNVAVYDFKSLYPSLIRTFQLDPLALAEAEAEGVEAPNGARFSRSAAILPDVIARFMERRDAAKRRGDRHGDQAIKIMMNALFGVLGAASCRFFDPAVANAITGFGQQTLHWTRDVFRDEGVPVIYGDTDSVFVQLTSGGARARQEAEALRERVQTRIGARIRQEYAVESRLELELEKVYEHFFLPRVRGGRSGSKKRYAGWLEGQLDVVGLEAVRRDWPAVAGRLQRGLLERLFTGGDTVAFAREVVREVREGSLDAELVYAKRVRKGSLERYTASTPPHVQAARKAGGRVGPVVRYVVTRGGPEPVLPGEPIPAAIDHAHYVQRVLRPVAEAILAPQGHGFDEVLGDPRQLPLL